MGNYTYSAYGLQVIHSGTTFHVKSRTTISTGATLSNKPSANKVLVRPNAYETGRANITVFNWQDLNSVAVDVSSAGLSVGQAFQVVDTQNFFGALSSRGFTRAERSPCQ